MIQHFIYLKEIWRVPIKIIMEKNMLCYALEKIKKFVEVYNKYLDYHRELTRAAKAEKPGDFTKTLSQSGLFMGDISLLRLESLLKTTINSAYPSRAEKPIKVFAQMGVSTGALNAEWDTIKSGKLIIDENLLKKSIRENPEGVALFFSKVVVQFRASKKRGLT